MSSKGARSRALAAAAVAAAALVWAPSALATNGSTTDATWAGGAPVPTGSADPGYLWSNGGANGANWVGGAVPASPLNVLNFPDLPACDASTPPATACYTSYDDLGSLDVNQLNFDAGSSSNSYNMYQAAGNSSSVTLEGDGTASNVGLVSNLGYGNFDLPILLTGSAAQTWNIENGQLYVAQIGDASGQSTPLTVSLANYGFLQVGSIPATGPVTVEGNGDLGVASGSGISNPTLPAVTLTGTTLLTVSTSTTSGAIDASADDGRVQVLGDPGSALDIHGNLSLGSSSEIDIDMDGNTASTSSSIDVTNGSVSLGGAPLVIDQNFEPSPSATCTTLKTGTTVTLVSASGGITGSLVVNGQSITAGHSATEPILNYCNEPEATAIITYNANSITATIAGAPVADTTHAPVITGSATVGDKLTVTDNGSWTASPTPTYSYQWESCSGTTCSPIDGATASSYTLTSGDAGRTIKVQVTATNSFGKATAFSNVLGPVQALGTSSGSGTGTPVTQAQIRAALRSLAYPRGHRALRLLLREGFFRAHFRAPAAGTLKVVWTTTVKTGHHRHTYVVARGSVHAGGARSVVLTIRLTATGRRLLRLHPFSLQVTASERFVVSGGPSASFVRKFAI